jgi:hypothetical protein
VNGFLLVSVKCRRQRPRADRGRCAGLGSCDSHASGGGVGPRPQPYKVGTVAMRCAVGMRDWNADIDLGIVRTRRRLNGVGAIVLRLTTHGVATVEIAVRFHERLGRRGPSRYRFPVTDRRTPSVSRPSPRRHPSEEPAAPGRHGNAPWKSCAPAPTAVPVNSHLHSAGRLLRRSRPIRTA